MRSLRKPFLPFDDSKLPVNNLTPERIEAIEKAAMPLFNEMLDKLRKEKPHLFKPSPSK